MATTEEQLDLLVETVGDLVQVNLVTKALLDSAAPAAQTAVDAAALAGERLDEVNDGLATYEVDGFPKADQPSAEAGTGTGLMTAIRAKQAIDAQRPLSDKTSAELGQNATKVMTPIRTYEEIDARLYQASAERYLIPVNGNTFTGTGTDATAILNQLAASGRKKVLFPPAYDAAVPTTGGILLNGIVSIPMRQSWIGEGKHTKFIVPVADPVAGYLRLNVDAAGLPMETYAHEPDQIFEGFYFEGRAAQGAGKKPVMLLFAGLARIRDLYSYGIQTLIKRVADGGGKISYSDLATIDRVYMNNQPSIDGWGIDLSLGSGDAISIKQIAADSYNGQLLEGDASKSRRFRLLRLGNAGTATIDGTINGDIEIWRSKASLQAVYQETGAVFIRESDVTLRDGVHYMRHESYGEWSVVPVQLVPPIDTAPSTYYVSLCMEHEVFHYSHGLPGEYSTTLHNFYIEPTLYAFVSIKNCWRMGPYTDSRASGQRLGITCGMADFDNYSHFASISSEYSGKRWIIQAEKGPIRDDEAAVGNVIETATILSGGLRKWKITTGTYYYKAIFYHDKIRKIGIQGANEVSVAMTINGGAADLRLSYGIGDFNGVVRMYRGNASGIFNYYVDVPIVDAVRLYDNGNDLSSFAWIAMTPGDIPVDAVNSGLTGGLSLKPGKVRTTDSDAYGQCTAISRSQVMPTCGGWRRGDKVLFAEPYYNGKEVVVGFERTTNCISTASANVINVDWVRIADLKTETNYMVATTAELNSAASDINTKTKFTGKFVLNTDTNIMVRCTSSTPTAGWRDFQGNVAHVPA